MNNAAIKNDWLQSATQKLRREGFAISENVTDSSSTMRAVARRTRFELTKCGFTDTFFVFREFESLNYKNDDLRRFSSDAFKFASQPGKYARVFCFAVAIAKHVEEIAIYSVRNDATPKHWKAAEIALIYNQADGRLYYFEKTPLYGFFYHPGFRSQIKKYLSYDRMA